MISVISGLPTGVTGIEAIGEITKSDYTSILDPLLDEALQSDQKIRLLYVMGGTFEGFSGGAAWEDTKLGAEHFNSFERVAVVTEHRWLIDASRALGWIMPGEVRGFGLDERQSAIDWLSS